MKAYRYGDAHYKHTPAFDDKAGKRFGTLTAIRREGSAWVCMCDCGAECTVLPGCLNRGSTRSCGGNIHKRAVSTGYSGMHSRIRTDRGPASTHPCTDCGHQAAQWSYDHADPDERADSDGVVAGLPYSLDLAHYDARCVSCHKLFDLHR